MALKAKKGEKSYLEQFTQILPSSVAFRFQELTGALPEAPESKVVWKSFESYTHKHQTHLLLILGLQNGFQVYKLHDDGVSLCPIVSFTEDCPIGTVKVLSYPSDSLVQWPQEENKQPTTDAFLAVTASAERSSFPRSCVKIFSVQTAKYVHTLRFKEPVRGIEVGHFVLVVALSKEIYVYKITYQPALEFELSFQTPCFVNPENYAVMALGSRWLAYAASESKPSTPAPVSISPSLSPNLPGQPVPSSDALVNMAQGFASGIYTLGGIGRQRLSAMLQGEALPIEEKTSANPHAGTLVVRDILNQQVLVHLKAHNSAISCLAFNKKGTLLVSVPEDGQYLSVFQVVRFPVDGKASDPSRPRAALSIVQLYLLFRGVTHATIRTISFSTDSKWLAASSLKGTTHLFAINENGGPITAKHAEESLLGLSPNLEPALCTVSALARIKHGSGVERPVAVAFHSLSSGDPIDHLAVLNNYDVLTLHRLTALQTDNVLGLDVHPIISWDLTSSIAKPPALMPFFEDLDLRPKGRSKLRKLHALTPLPNPPSGETKSAMNFLEDEDSFDDDIPAVIHAREGSVEPVPDATGRWLSHVELETSQATIPIWSTPQFTMFEFEPRSSKRSTNALDNLFIEDQPQRALKYEKFKPFANLIAADVSEPIESQIEGALEQLGTLVDGEIPPSRGSEAAAPLAVLSRIITINEGFQHFTLPASTTSSSPSASPTFATANPCCSSSSSSSSAVSSSFSPSASSPLRVTSPKVPISPSTSKSLAMLPPESSSFALPPSEVTALFASKEQEEEAHEEEEEAEELASHARNASSAVPPPSGNTSPLLNFFAAGGAAAANSSDNSNANNFLPSSRSPFGPTGLANSPVSFSPSLTASLAAFPSPSLTPSLTPSLPPGGSPSLCSLSPKAAAAAAAATTSSSATNSPHKRSRRRKGRGETQSHHASDD